MISAVSERYQYDELNQLIREDSQSPDSDTSGEVWQDQLVSWTDGATGNVYTMTYDQVGNLLSKGSRTFEWKLGRKLAKVTDEMTTASYEYDHTGNRVKKTVTEVDGTKVETAYHMAGDLLLSEKTGSQTIWFEYDSSANLVSMKTGGKRYFYIKNVQNDIVGLADANGNVVVRYQYDAWGKLLNIIGEIEIGVKNPFRYRGYYYDTETGMYYLKSRYYDSVIRRFVSEDSNLGQVGVCQSHNMYEYSFNNPIMYSDASGNWPKLSTVFTVIGVAAAFVAVGALCVATGGMAALAVAGGGVVTTATATTAITVAGTATAVAVTATVAAGVSKTIENSSSRSNNNSKNKSHTVYGLQDGKGNIQYVGRTTDIDNRRNAHEANPARAGLTMTVLADNLSYEAARGVEQTYMLYHHTINTANRMNNQINGISIKNKKLGLYIEAARGALGYTWNQVSNEILYWTEF